MKFVICILVVFFAATSSATKFTFNGTLACSSEEKWCYTVEAKELDMFSNDLIHRHAACHDPKEAYHHGPIPFHLTGEQEDDGIFDNFFELALLVSHNCSGKDETVTEDFLPIPVTRKTHDVVKQFNLNNNEIIKLPSEIHENMDFIQ